MSTCKRVSETIDEHELQEFVTNAIGLGSTSGRVIAFLIFCRIAVNSHQEVLKEHFSRIGGHFEWAVISGLFLIEFVSSAYFLLRVA
jgi:hypothetical protein